MIRLAWCLPLALQLACALPATEPGIAPDSADPADATDPAPDPTDVGLDPGATDPATDPFAALPDAAQGLTNVSADLEALLENGALEGACQRWEADPTDEAKRLMCGKSMFFYEGFEGMGFPADLVDTMTDLFPAEVGVGHSEFGLIADPFSPQNRPLGFPEGGPLGTVDTLAFGCAACHFGQLPDGRYAVGQPNLSYDYGRHMMAVSIAPMAANPFFNTDDHHPGAVQAAQPILDALDGSPALSFQLMLRLLPLMGAVAEIPQMSVETEGYYASWEPGTMDFVIEPLPLDDGVHTVTKILPLWEIPTEAQAQALGAPHAMLAWTGAGVKLMDFLEGFIAITGAAEDWPPARLEPLEAYLLSLRAPVNPDRAPESRIVEGRQVFDDMGCLDCHAGPRGGGLDVYAFEEVGTDVALASWGDPNELGEPCCGLDLDVESSVLTEAVKAPRLTGLWTQDRFLHNGSVLSLEALLCLEDRRGISELAYGDGGHEYGCDAPVGERELLLDFLLSR